MRIGIDVKAFKNGSTGIARYLRSVMDCLQSIDSENEYFLFECRPSTYEVKNPKWNKILIPWKLPGILWQQFILPFHLKKWRIDVLWAAEQICPLWFMGDIKIITTIYDIAFVHFPETYQWSNLLIQKFLTPMVLKKSDALIAISDFIKRDVLSQYHISGLEQKLTAVPCGKPDWQIPAGYSPANRKDFLFFAGNNEPRKNLMNLLKALELLHSQGRDIKLHIAGPAGWKNKNISEFLSNSSIKDQVKFLGYLTEDQLKEQYLSCKAFIYPSLYEGFGLPVLEAIVMDCPVLTARGTVMEENAQACAAYFDPNNCHDIASVISMHVSGVTDAHIGREERQIVLKRYDWRKTAEQVLNVFKSVCNA